MEVTKPTEPELVRGFYLCFPFKDLRNQYLICNQLVLPNTRRSDYFHSCLRYSIKHDKKANYLKYVKRSYEGFIFNIQLIYVMYIILFHWVWDKSKSIYVKEKSILLKFIQCCHGANIHMSTATMSCLCRKTSTHTG